MTLRPAPALAVADPPPADGLQAAPTAIVGYHEIPIEQIRTSPLNPRRTLGDLTDLAASIAAAGILEPLIVRPAGRVNGAPDSFEIVAGARRYSAARQVGLLLVPCLVRKLTDAQLLEVALIENNQRGDIHPLEEAEALHRLSRLDRAYTPEVLSAKIGRPLAYVRGRLRLLDLAAEVREAFAEDRITIGHADRIAKLAPELQALALMACFHPLYGHGTETEVLRPLHDLDSWIKARTVLDVTSAHTQEALPELVAQVAQAEAEGATLVQLSTAYKPEHGLKGKAAPLPASKWRTVGPKACAHVTRGVVVYGETHRAEILTVCLKASKCPTHWPEAPKAETAEKGAAPTKPQWQINQERREAAKAAWDAIKPAAVAAIVAHTKGQKVTPALVTEVVSNRLADVPAVRTITAKNMGQALALYLVLEHDWSETHLAEAAKRVIGFDLKAWAKTHRAAASAPAAKKKAAKGR